MYDHFDPNLVDFLWFRKIFVWHFTGETIFERKLLILTKYIANFSVIP